MADKLVSQDPAQPGVFKVNGPTLAAGGQVSLSGLDTTGAAANDVIVFNGANWVAGVAPTTGANVGAGTGLIFRDKTANNINLKSLVAGAGITVTNNASDITITSTASITGIFTLSYTSPNQTITSAGSLTLAHLMAGMPTLIQCRIQCTTGEVGYSIGDQLMVDNNCQETGSYGLSIVPDATNINIRYGVNTFLVLNKTTGTQTSITAGFWQLIVRAWR